MASFECVLAIHALVAELQAGGAQKEDRVKLATRQEPERPDEDVAE